MTVWLCTDDAWNVNRKIFHVAGGVVALAHEETPYRQIQREGKWTVEELVTLVPNSLMAGIQNPAPPPAGTRYRVVRRRRLRVHWLLVETEMPDSETTLDWRSLEAEMTDVTNPITMRRFRSPLASDWRVRKSETAPAHSSDQFVQRERGTGECDCRGDRCRWPRA